MMFIELVLFLLYSSLVSALPVDTPEFDDLVRYTKYSSAAYQKICPRPLGNALVMPVS